LQEQTIAFFYCGEAVKGARLRGMNCAFKRLSTLGVEKKLGITQ
jgi:hypothetical protein